MILPDSHIDRACLDKKLLAGNYDGVCQIELFDMDTLELLGTLEEKNHHYDTEVKSLAKYILIWYNNKNKKGCTEWQAAWRLE